MHTVFAQHLDFRWQNINTRLCNTCCRYLQYVGIALRFTLSLFFITIYSLFFIVLLFICIMYHRDRTIQLFCGCAIQVAKHFKRRIVYSVNMMIWQKFNARVLYTSFMHDFTLLFDSIFIENHCDVTCKS